MNSAKIYIAFSYVPFAIAVVQRERIVASSLALSDMTGEQLLELIAAAQKALEDRTDGAA